MNIYDTVICNLNTWLVMLGAGVVVWAIRQVFTRFEGTKVWRVALRVLPIGLGALIALIPGLRPMPENLAQSSMIGIIGGSFGTTAYELLRELAPENIRLALGSKYRRDSMLPPEPK
jgi:hypothetical protein